MDEFKILSEPMMFVAIAFGVGCLISFLYYCIGSPSVDSESGKIEVVNGRIFSIWGRFVASRYAAFENRQNGRVWSDFEEYKQKRIEQHEIDMSRALTSAEQTQLIQKLSDDLQGSQDRIRTNPNPWMAAGVCPICFGTWVSLLFWLLSPIVFGINPGFIIFGIATSVIISNRIRL